MIVRLIAVTACLFLLSAFSDDEKKKLITACAGSLSKAKEQGRGIPDAAVQNRVKICTCIGDGLAKDTSVSPGEKAKIAQIYELGAQGNFQGARDLQKTVDRSVNPVMRKLTQDCTREYRKPTQ